MIRRRALVSLKHHQAQAQQSRTTKPFISRSSSSSSPLLFSPPSSLSNQKRFAVRCLAVPFSAAPWNSSGSGVGFVKKDGGVSGVRKMSTRTMRNNDSSNRPPKDTILLDGCDFEHWLVVMDNPDPNLTRDDIIDSYIKTLAQIVGSEEEARKSIYSVSTKHYFAFSCVVSEELSNKIKDLQKVRWVLPDSYLDVPNKSYGGEPFINGQAVPYDPKYHEVYVRNQINAQNNNRKNKDRRRNDSTVGRRRENMMNRDMPPPSPAPNPISRTPMGSPNQNFTAASNYQNQARSSPVPNRDFSNRGVPSPGPSSDSSQMQNPDYQRRDMPAQVQNSNFQNRNTPIQNQNFQTNYAPPPTQNREFQTSDVSSMRNMESPGRNIPPIPPTQVQNWSSSSRDMQHSMPNQNFQSNLHPSMQDKYFANRDMPPLQNPSFQNGSNIPPVQNPGFLNGSNMPPVQKPGFQNGDRLSPQMQNWGMPNQGQNPGFQNVPSSNFHNAHSVPSHDFHSNGMPARVENHNSRFRQAGNIQPGYQQNQAINMGVMPINQNREIPSFTKSVNMQNRDYQGHDMSGFTNSVNMQNGSYQGREMPSNINRQNAQNIDHQGWGSSYNSEMANSPGRDHRSQNMSGGEYQAAANTSF